MKVTNISLSNNYGDPSGNLTIYGDETAITVTLTPDESRELLAVGLRIFERRQAGIAKSIADMKPELLPVPGAIDGNFEEVEDDVPF